MDVKHEIVFGCSLESLNTQFGLNSNPTVYTIMVIQEAGQTFDLANMPKNGIRAMSHVYLGALDMYGPIQSWEQTEIDIAGTGIYEVRMVDMRVAMDAVQVLLEAPFDAVLGTNVVGVTPQESEDLNSGIKYSWIRQTIEKWVYKFGDIQFRMDLSAIPINEYKMYAPGDYYYNETIYYRVRGSAMSLVEFIQQVADDQGFDWFVETTPDDDGVYRVKIIPIIRTYVPLTMQALADKHPNAVLKLSRGHESRDEVTRTVLVGAQKQYLSKEDGWHWKPFWGFTEDGQVLTQPEFKLLSLNGTARRRVTSIAEIEKALNDQLTGLPEDELAALKSYADEYWGKQFYAEVNPAQIDDNGEPWIDVATAGWWDSDLNPEFLPDDEKIKLCTDDGRWVCFVKLNGPSTVAGTWDASVLGSHELIQTGMNRYYMKASVQRVDLLRNTQDDKIPITYWKFRKAAIFHLSLPVPLVIQSKSPTQTTLSGGTHTTGGDFRPTRMTTLGDVYLPLMDRRHTYGPWSSDSITPKGFQHDGKTRVVVDTSLAPWTFAWRDIDMRQAHAQLNAVATARLRASTIEFMEIDTGQLEAAGLPVVNLGTAIGYGTNITSINCSYDTKGIRTLYKCNVYTGELGRHQRMYQELVDKLRRDAQRRQNTQYPQNNYWAINKELNALKKGLGNDRSTATDSSATEEKTAKIVSREKNGPFYLCNVMKEVVVNGFIKLEESMVGGVMTTNLAEMMDKAGHMAMGSIVKIRPAKVTTSTDKSGKPVTTIWNYVMDEHPGAPGPITCIISGKTGDTSVLYAHDNNPTYWVEYKSGDLGGLSDDELCLLGGGIMNIAEPRGVYGNLAIGTVVNVHWVKVEPTTPTQNINVNPNVPDWVDYNALPINVDVRYIMYWPVIEHSPDIFKDDLLV